MSFRKRRVILSTPFFMITNFILLKYLFLLFCGIDTFILIGIVILLAVLHLVPMLFELKKSTSIGRFLSKIYGIWMWFFIFLTIATVLIYIINCFISLLFIHKVCIYLCVIILAIYNYIHANNLIIKERTIYLDNLTEEINIVHFSDVHFGSIRHKKFIKKIADNLRELSKTCDLAIISGDLADGSCIVEEDDFLVFKDIGMPIIFTAGNHDFYPGIENVYKAAKKAGIIVLDNESMEFKGSNIFGVTFSFDEIEPLSPDKLVSSIKNDSGNIVIFHAPANWEDFSRLGFDIQLSGHTHGGQFYPAIWFCKLMFGFNKGLFKDSFNTSKNHYLHVTTGVGTMDYPMRWGTDSELVVLKLRKK